MEWKRRSFFVSLLIVASQLYVSSATGLHGGQDAVGDDRVVYVDVYPNIPGGGCTGALIEPRTVFTAGHCLNAYWGDKSKTRFATQVEIEPMLVYEPGAIASRNSEFKYAQVIGAFRSTKYTPSNEKSGPLFDFAVLILDKSLGTKTFEVANKDQIVDFINTAKSAVSIGYGYSSWQDFQNYQNGLGKDPKPHRQNVIFRKDLIQSSNMPTLNENSIVQTLMPLDSYNCSGDSGGPLWVQEGEKWIYVGALSGAMGANCTSNPNDKLWTDEFWSKNRGSTYWTAQAFPEVISEAKTFLNSLLKAEEESAKAKKQIQDKASKKTVITCTKGNKQKKISGVKPKCPAGYRKL